MTGETPYRVAFRPTMTHRETLVYAALMLVGALLSVRYFVWWFDLGHIPGDPGIGGDSPLLNGALIGLAPFLLLTLVEGVRVASAFVLWIFALFMEDPLPMKARPGLKVAILTTIVPSKEPIEMVERTLRASRRIRYDGRVDLWLLDEGDDDRVKEMCRRLGVNHFTRKDVPEWNQPEGTFRARTKAGNHNAWRDAHEEGYDLVAQMDPDHVPYENFLERTVGYFQDPDVGYVVSPQIYGNHEESWLARGSDEQAFVFHGVVQRGANGFGTPILIGTNHIYRPAAMAAGGGYMGMIVEDHPTGLAITGQDNPETGNRWKGVYVPEAISIGEGPISWNDYLSQQMRWAYGMFEIIRDIDGRLLPRLSALQAFGYVMLQTYYGFAALVFVCGNLLTFLYLSTGLSSADMNLAAWWWLWLPHFLWGFVIWYWLQRFYLYQNQGGTNFTGYIMTFACFPVFAQAAFAALTGRKVPYVVTAKGSARTRDSLGVFRIHMIIAGGGLAVLAASLFFGNDAWQLRTWALITIIITAGFPIGLWTAQRLEQRRPQRQPVALPSPSGVPIRSTAGEATPDAVAPPLLPPLVRPSPDDPEEGPARSGLQPAYMTLAANGSLTWPAKDQASTGSGGRLWHSASEPSPAQRRGKPSTEARRLAAVALHRATETVSLPVPRRRRILFVLPMLGIAGFFLVMFGGILAPGYPAAGALYGHLPLIDALAGTMGGGGDWYDGWYGGYPHSTIDSFVAYLPAALLTTIGVDLLLSAKAQILASILIGAFSMFWACQELLRRRSPTRFSPSASVAGAGTFAFSPALLSIMFGLGEMPAFTAAVLAPLPMGLLFRAAHDRSSYPWALYGSSLALLTLLDTGVALCVLGAGLVWTAASGLLTVAAGRGFFTAAAVLVGLSAFWTVPFLAIAPDIASPGAFAASASEVKMMDIVERAVSDGQASWYAGIVAISLAVLGLALAPARRLVAPFLVLAAAGTLIAVGWLPSLSSALPFPDAGAAAYGGFLVALGLGFAVAVVVDEVVGRPEKMPWIAHGVGLALAVLVAVDLSVSSGIVRSHETFPEDLTLAAAFVRDQQPAPLERTAVVAATGDERAVAMLPALTGISLTGGYSGQATVNAALSEAATAGALSEGRVDEALELLSLFNTRYIIVDQENRLEAARDLLESGRVEQSARYGRWLILEISEPASPLHATGTLVPIDSTVEQYEPAAIELRTSLDEAATVVPALSWSPGWSVTVDGQRVEAADYSQDGRGGFVSFPLGPGEHSVELEHDPTAVQSGARLFSGAFGLLIGVWVISALVHRRGLAAGEAPPTSAPRHSSLKTWGGLPNIIKSKITRLARKANSLRGEDAKPRDSRS